MPASRSTSSKSRKARAVKPPPSSKHSSKTSGSNGVKRFTCHAWWCSSTFGRRADMTKHVGMEHFGKRSYCTLCHAVMKQGSNLITHLNTHLSNHCTLCSCGRGFTDPSAYSRHREALGHAKGITHGQVRPSVIKGIKVQHVAGLELTVGMISDPTFIPPSFDESYHLMGQPKPKGQEKYNPRDYVVTELIVLGGPDVPSAQVTGTSSTDGAPAAEYQEAEQPPPAQNKIRVDDLGIHTSYSYDVDLPQEPVDDQAQDISAYNPHPHQFNGIPSDSQPTPIEVAAPHRPHSTTAICGPTHPTYDPAGVSTDLHPHQQQKEYLHRQPGFRLHQGSRYYPYPHPKSGCYPHQQPERYPVATNDYAPPLPQPFVAPYAYPGHWEAPYPQRASCDAPRLVPQSLPGVPSQWNAFEGMRFGIPTHGQFQDPQYQQAPVSPINGHNAGSYDRTYHPSQHVY